MILTIVFTIVLCLKKNKKEEEKEEEKEETEKEEIILDPQKQETEMEVKITPYNKLDGTGIYLNNIAEVRIIKSCGDSKIDSYKAKIMKEAAELETNPNRIILLNNIQIKNIQVHLGDIYGNELKKI